MGVDIRPYRDGDLEGLTRQDGRSFGFHYSERDVEERLPMLELDRFLLAVEDGDVVGVTGTFTKELTVPGGRCLPAGAVTWVSVAATHRRQGILTALTMRQFDDVSARGEPLTILMAAEGGIYGRFGYGIASNLRRLEVDRYRARLRDGAGTRGRLRYVYGDEARRLLPPVYDRFRRARPGSVDRNDAWWEFLFLDPESARGGASARWNVVFESDGGAVDGFVSYRIASEPEALPSGMRLDVVDFVACTDDATAAMWRFVLGVDLVTTIRSYLVAGDDPLRWLLADPRQARTSRVDDGLWVRLLDVPAALAGRSYGTADRLVLEVSDPFRPESGGTFVVEGDASGAEAWPAPEGLRADLALGASALGTVYLGGFRPSALARAGLVDEVTPGVLARADAFFAAEREPYLHTWF
jgi:predicted acetyltransferase